MADQALEVKGLRELRNELRALDTTLPRELRKTNKEVADYVRDCAQGRATSGTAQQAKAKSGIRSGAEQTAARLVIGGARNPFAIGAYFGAKAFPQFPAWVGNQWTPGDTGGPHVIGPTIQDELPEVIDRYGDAIEHLARKAFPDRI